MPRKPADCLDIENFSHVITEEEFWSSLPRVQWHMDEPSADPAAVALYFVDKEAAKKVKAVLSGEGSTNSSAATLFMRRRWRTKSLPPSRNRCCAPARRP